VELEQIKSKNEIVEQSTDHVSNIFLKMHFKFLLSYVVI
jgi:hypothetical protein